MFYHIRQRGLQPFNGVKVATMRGITKGFFDSLNKFGFESFLDLAHVSLNKVVVVGNSSYCKMSH